MRKIILVALLAFISSSALPCSGIYYARDGQDGWNIYDDFVANCCKGSTITIVNLETGNQITITTINHGSNSTCGIEIADPE